MRDAVVEDIGAQGSFQLARIVLELEEEGSCDSRKTQIPDGLRQISDSLGAACGIGEHDECLHPNSAKVVVAAAGSVMRLLANEEYPFQGFTRKTFYGKDKGIVPLESVHESLEFIEARLIHLSTASSDLDLRVAAFQALTDVYSAELERPDLKGKIDQFVNAMCDVINSRNNPAESKTKMLLHALSFCSGYKITELDGAKERIEPVAGLAVAFIRDFENLASSAELIVGILRSRHIYEFLASCQTGIQANELSNQIRYAELLEWLQGARNYFVVNRSGGDGYEISEAVNTLGNFYMDLFDEVSCAASAARTEPGERRTKVSPHLLEILWQVYNHGLSQGLN